VTQPATTPSANDLDAALRVPYRERAQLVALLAAVYPSHIGYTDPNEPDWAVAIVETPAGQLSRHISRDDMDLFEHVLISTSEDRPWDGHSTEQKYQRVRDLIAQLEAGQAGAGAPVPVLAGVDAADARLNQIAQQLGILFQIAPQCATCAADVRQGARPAPNLANVIVDGTGLCHEHVDVVSGRLVPKTSGGLILGGGR
jgi:hypothetical protein